MFEGDTGKGERCLPRGGKVKIQSPGGALGTSLSVE